ncbi:MAG: hypothetical protein AAFR44_09700 [Pseudomonadota bacterium]
MSDTPAAPSTRVEAQAAEDEPIKLTFRLEPTDIFDMLFAPLARDGGLRRLPSRWKTAFRASILFVALPALLGWAAVGTEAAATMAIGSVLAIVLFIVSVAVSMLRFSLRVIAEMVDGPNATVFLGPRGVRMLVAGSERFVAWRAVTALKEEADGWLLVHPLGGIPLPERGMPEGLTRAELGTRLRAWSDAAGPQV